MRKIEFRGKRIDNGKWVYGFYRKNTFYDKLGNNPKEVYTKHFIGAFSNLELFDTIFEQVEVIPETIGQYTGLKDKNGVKIFEHDVLKHENSNVIPVNVIWDNDTASFVFNDLYYSIYDTSFYVVGNIFDNPELL